MTATYEGQLMWVSRWKQAADSRLAGLNKLGFSVWISRGAGLALSLDGTLILLPMCKNILRWIRPKIRWLPLDESQWFHRQVAYSLLFYSIIHVCCHYVKSVHQNFLHRHDADCSLASTTSRGIRFGQTCLPFKFTTQRQVALRAT